MLNFYVLGRALQAGPRGHGPVQDAAAWGPNLSYRNAHQDISKNVNYIAKYA